MSRTALMLCYFFPPLSGGGVQRSLQFAKYLPEFGWDPVVITVVPNRRNVVEQGRDDASARSIEQRCAVHRAKSSESSVLFTVTYRLKIRKLLFELERLLPNMQQDYKHGWVGPALRLARRLVPTLDEPMVAYSSAPPYSALRVGLRLHESPGLPWVADYRDPLTVRASYHPGTTLQHRIDLRLDRAVVAAADAVIVNTEADARAFTGELGLAPERMHLIPNGFDPEDFAPDPAHAAGGNGATDGFRVTCVGKFYETTDPGAFFHAFRRFGAAHGDVSLRFLAPLSRGSRLAAESELNGIDWSVHARLPHADAVQEMKRASVLLANLHEDWVHPVPGKLYEYLAARRPVLFIGPAGSDAAAIVRRANAGEISGFDEPSILRSLETLYDRHRRDPDGFSSCEKVIEEFDRREQVRRLAAIFDSVAARRSR